MNHQCHIKVGNDAEEEESISPHSHALAHPPTCFMARIWAADPTLLTDSPTLIAGRMPL